MHLKLLQRKCHCISGTLTLGGNLIVGSATVTEAQLEILDGATVTTDELNLIDGGATVGTTAIADGDGLLINDAGTMRVSTVHEITSMPNLTTAAALVTVSALDTGSITSGFGNIDVGAGAITTTGTGTIGNLVVDDVNVNGNISSTAGTDLTITPLSGQQIVLDGTIVVDAGVVTGATSITSTAFVGDITGDVTGTADVATVLLRLQ